MMGRLDNRPENHLLSHMALALDGDSHACFDLGVAYSTGASGLEVDLVQAHKWFNIAAMSGSREGQHCRAEISQEMTRTDIAEAQRQARAWMASIARPQSADRSAQH
jgi:TPR repeat protein